METLRSFYLEGLEIRFLRLVQNNKKTKYYLEVDGTTYDLESKVKPEYFYDLNERQLGALISVCSTESNPLFSKFAGKIFMSAPQLNNDRFFTEFIELTGGYQLFTLLKNTPYTKGNKRYNNLVREVVKKYYYLGVDPTNLPQVKMANLKRVRLGYILKNLDEKSLTHFAHALNGLKVNYSLNDFIQIASDVLPKKTYQAFISSLFKPKKVLTYEAPEGQEFLFSQQIKWKVKNSDFYVAVFHLNPKRDKGGDFRHNNKILPRQKLHIFHFNDFGQIEWYGGRHKGEFLDKLKFKTEIIRRTFQQIAELSKESQDQNLIKLIKNNYTDYTEKERKFKIAKRKYDFGQKDKKLRKLYNENVQRQQGELVGLLSKKQSQDLAKIGTKKEEVLTQDYYVKVLRLFYREIFDDLHQGATKIRPFLSEWRVKRLEKEIINDLNRLTNWADHDHDYDEDQSIVWFYSELEKVIESVSQKKKQLYEDALKNELDKYFYDESKFFQGYTKGQEKFYQLPETPLLMVVPFSKKINQTSLTLEKIVSDPQFKKYFVRFSCAPPLHSHPQQIGFEFNLMKELLHKKDKDGKNVHIKWVTIKASYSYQGPFNLTKALRDANVSYSIADKNLLYPKKTTKPQSRLYKTPYEEEEFFGVK